jgi:hypothetical protein
MSDPSPYGSPEAARRAVTDRLRTVAATSPWTATDLQRQFAYDQLLERLYRVDPGWIVKGATALLARRVAVRHTLDIDLFHAGAIGNVEQLARAAAAVDLGDWVHFELGPSSTIRAGGGEARRIGVQAFIGGRLWTQFKIDIIAAGITLAGVPEPVPPLIDLGLSSLGRSGWLAYPIEDHVADKIHAILERTGSRPSTRYKDLVDLVAIAARCVLDADTAKRALAQESERRRVALPTRFEVPDRRLWSTGYAKIARAAVNLAASTLDEALAVVCPLADPLLDGTAKGQWHPARHRWS